MTQQMERNPNHGRGWRIAARLWGTVAAAFWFLTILAHVLAEPITEIAGEGLVLGILITAITILTALAWRWEQEAGALLLFCGIALSLFALSTAGRNHIFAMLVSGAPFILSGCLFMASAWMNQTDDV